MLAVFAHGGTTPPGMAEKLAANPLDRRELSTVMSYVLRRTTLEKLDVDARWNARYQIDSLILQANGAGAEAQQLQLLQDLLDQLHFKVTLPQTSNVSAAIASQQEALDSLAEGSHVALSMPADFAPVMAPFALEVDGRRYQVSIRPTSARPSLNHLPRDAMARYLRRCGLTKERAEDLAALVADWRGDLDKSRLSQSAQGYYLSQSAPYARRDAPIESWGEIAFLQQVSPADLAFLKRHFVLHGANRFVHPDFLDPGQLAAIADLTESEIAKALELRHPGVNSSGEQRSLEDVIGATAAARYDAAISDLVDQASPVIVTVEGPGGAMSLVYDRKSRAILESLE